MHTQMVVHEISLMVRQLALPHLGGSKCCYCYIPMKRLSERKCVVGEGSSLLSFSPARAARDCFIRSGVQLASFLKKYTPEVLYSCPFKVTWKSVF